MATLDSRGLGLLGKPPGMSGVLLAPLQPRGGAPGPGPPPPGSPRAAPRSPLSRAPRLGGGAGALNYAALREALEGQHGMPERQAAVLDRVCRANAAGVPIRDLHHGT